MTKKNTKNGGVSRDRVIAAAEELFTQKGFNGVSVRDIAKAAGIQPASMYHHFVSKEELLWVVWEKGGLEMLSAFQDAVAQYESPWDRLNAACIAHVKGLHDWERANQVLFVIPPWQYPEGIRDKVIKLRDQYEAGFADIIATLPLKPDIDLKTLRLTLIGALSWTLFWYKGDRNGLDAVALNIVALLREDITSTT
ncbi:TetR/AcrR family transcriptional regulator [Rhodobacteraceae bacterium LMO-12]|nr:TetR/AcrR family transcriptional regulator [Rhodobacteraceae bacterium LMO-JJ12]